MEKDNALKPLVSLAITNSEPMLPINWQLFDDFILVCFIID